LLIIVIKEEVVITYQLMSRENGWKIKKNFRKPNSEAALSMDCKQKSVYIADFRQKDEGPVSIRLIGMA
jgi:hypothetical protein